jgi:hypothetical protein
MVVSLTEGAQPDLKHVALIGGEVGQVLAVGGQLGAGALGVVEEDLAGDQRRKLVW